MRSLLQNPNIAKFSPTNNAIISTSKSYVVYNITRCFLGEVIKTDISYDQCGVYLIDTPLAILYVMMYLIKALCFGQIFWKVKVIFIYLFIKGFTVQN